MESLQPQVADGLDEARREIDDADHQLIRQMARRFDAVRRIAEAKRAEGARPLLDTDREREVQARWLQDSEALGLLAPFVRRILKEVLDHSRRLQEPLLAGRETPTRTLTVGYQGIPGSYSSLAAAHLLATRASAGVDLIGHPTFPEVIDALRAGELDYAFLPVENSIGGSIHDVNRLICDQVLHIVDEDVWEVKHVLAAPPGASLATLRTVRSHPAALIQCETFLKSLEGVTRQPWFDTAGAAESLAGVSELEVGAICSEEAAQLHGLSVLAHAVADCDRNETRFLLLARHAEIPDPRIPSKTSLLFRLNHHEGSLARALSALAEAGINLTRIESRPMPETPWEYLFFVDVEGHLEAPNVAGAVQRLQAQCNHLRVLGCYPHRFRKQDPHVPLPLPLPAPEPAVVCPAPQVRELLQAPPERAPGVVRVGPVSIGPGRFVLIAGPCAVESEAQIQDAARMVRSAGAAILRGGAFKPRTSPYAFQGLGVEGLRYLRDAGRAFELPVVTEVLTIEDIPAVAAHASALQVGARNMHNFALLKELGRLDKPIILKRGMSATLKELVLAAEYILAGGNQQVILCERGIRTFEPSTRATLDLSAVPVLRGMTHLPVIVDPSHAAGRRDLVVPLALAAAAAGADGLIVEAHPRPEEALCDKEQALTAEDLRQMVAGLRPIVESQGRTW